jgi:PAS domain S-box-containing protein
MPDSISVELYRSAFEKSGAASIIVAPDMTMIMSNEEFEKLTGYAKHEIEGRMKWSEIVAPEDVGMMSRYHYARRTPGANPPAEYYCRIVTRSGETRHIHMKVGMLPDGLQSIASFMDITELKQTQKALEEREMYLSRENVQLKSGIQDRFRFGPMVGKSRAMQQVYEMIVKAAATDANVIVYGESGTGKELAARAIHDMSERKNAAFVTINCGAVPENLLESEFFGHRKGAFTGAEKDKAGYLDQADGGTLFLDEIGELGLNLQVKLLRVIEGMGFQPVGGGQMHHPNVRIIGATNRNLTDQVLEGRMREDFYYRIHVIPIHLPPLRDRKEDIPLLIEKFLQLYAIRGPVPLVTGEMMDAANACDWPGNVRELQNVLHRYVVLGRFEVPGILKPEKRVKPAKHLYDGTRQAAEEPVLIADGQKMTLPERVENYERREILNALSRHQWHRGKAADSLGIHRRTLFKKIKKFGIDNASIENDRSQ